MTNPGSGRLGADDGVSVTPRHHRLKFIALPWHPALFAAVIVITLLLDAAVSPYAAARPLLVAVAAAVTVAVVASILLRSPERGGIFTSGVIGLLWSKQLLVSGRDIVSRMGPAAILWVMLLLIALFLVLRILRRGTRRLTVTKLTALLNRAAVMLLVATLGLGVISGRLPALFKDLEQGVDLAAWTASPSEAAPPRPDIYVILLDGYPRADVLEFAFDLDNAPFTDALGEREFRVADGSHSDYLWTHVSVPSALNLAYVEQIEAMRDVIENRVPRQPTLRGTIANNVAFDQAREHGYTPIAVGAGFEEVAPRRADVYVDGGQLNEFEISLIASTFGGEIVAALAPDFASGQQRERIVFNLDVLAEIASTRDRPPALVFAHVPAPHQPIVFGDGGEPVAVPISGSWFADSPQERGEPQAEFLDRYRAQLPYLNDRILAAIDEIVANAEQPPVIVLFADHGSASAVNWNKTQPKDADPARLLERTGTLFAALTPERERVFPDDISPVDIFRLLFDAYLGTDHGRATPPPDGGQIRPVDASVLDR